MIATRVRLAAVLPLILVPALWMLAGERLEVTSAGPQGEIADVALASEIRVEFSEPMVALGRISDPVVAPFFEIAPAVEGTFRWAGTRTLVFTPTAPLPHATRYRVTIAAKAATASISGHTLAEPYVFSFVTPTIRLLSLRWYREGNRYDGQVVVALRFNQPVATADVLRSARLAYLPHDWKAPSLSAEGRARLESSAPGALAAFESKVAAARAAAAATSAVALEPAPAWDEKQFPPAADLVVLRTPEVPRTNAWMRLALAPTLAAAGREPAGKVQEYVLKLEPTFFVRGFDCRRGCNPEAYNPLGFWWRVSPRALRPHVRVAELGKGGVAAPQTQAPAPKDDGEDQEPSLRVWGEPYLDNAGSWARSRQIALDALGYTLSPARRYLVEVGPDVVAEDGQRLGYTWADVVENWHAEAYTSFESGHGVWEASGGSRVPFHARNLSSLVEWVAPVSLDDLVPRLAALVKGKFAQAPEGPGRDRRLNPRFDTMEHHELELAPHLSPRGTGIVWAALKDGTPIPRSRLAEPARPARAALLQVTNLGITVKDSPENTLVFVTRLDDGAPVGGAGVAIRTLDNALVWSGATDARGIAIAPQTPGLRGPAEGGGEDEEGWWSLRFVVTAQKDGDMAYLGSDWNDGMLPWEFGIDYDLEESAPLLRGTVFSDRGVYRLGEEVRFKAILRRDTAAGIGLVAGQEAEIVVRDSQGTDVATRTVTLSSWSSADWSWSLPERGALGTYTVTATVAGQQLRVQGEFLVAAYRRPDFRVDATLAAEPAVAGAAPSGMVEARYLFGGSMAGRPVSWSFTRRPVSDVPAAIRERFPEERWSWLDFDAPAFGNREEETVSSGDDELDAEGRFEPDLETKLDAGVPFAYTLEGDVEDVSRQTIAGRTSLLVHPAPWYLGLARPGYFVEAKKGLATQVAASALDGKLAPGVPIDVTLARVQWNSVRRAEGQGYYTWETERRETEVGSWKMISAAEPLPLAVPLPEGGYYILRARARDAEGRRAAASVSFYALGGGYTAWERFDHNRIDLVPERTTYKPGDTARILVKSPWERATALVTTEREGIKSSRQINLGGTQQTIEVPITDEDVPNVYVSVVLVQGRTSQFTDADASDPGKPSYRIGYASLRVEDPAKRLRVAVTADREEYRPAAPARVSVTVADHRGRGVASEVTLWAVDYGVLSLTGYQTPDVVDSVYVKKALQVLTEDSRQRIVSRRVITAKGADEGGGGGEPSQTRKDFRVLAFWMGSLITDASGRASAEIVLPESLTTYRIMAVAADQASRFGAAQAEIRTAKPLMLTPSLPRFLALGDRATAGAVLHSTFARASRGTVTVESLDPAIVSVEGEATRAVELAAKGAAEARVTLVARGIGDARLRISAKVGSERDAFEHILPVRLARSPEVVAAYGIAAPDSREEIVLPEQVVPGFGGLRVELASTALVGLNEGARYLVDYPYGCAEQRASAALALVLLSDLGDAYALPGIEPARLKTIAQTALDELREFQCGDGGFGFWRGECSYSSPYLTSWMLHVVQSGAALGYRTDAAVTAGALGFLESALAETPPQNEGWMPAYTAWQAFAVDVLAAGGKPQDSHVTRLYGYADRMPVFALSHLADAMQRAGESGARPAELARRIANAILPEAGTAHVEELSDPYLLHFWSSNPRSTAIVLGGMARRGAPAERAAQLARWLLMARRDGRWGNTQENAWAMEALVDYWRRYESEVPDFTATATLGVRDLARERFSGRSTRVAVTEMGLEVLREVLPSGAPLPLVLHREGKGALHWNARLTYAPAETDLPARDSGFRLWRSYELATEQAAETAGAEADQAPRKAEAVWRVAAGQLVRVTLTLELSKERRWVAVTDPVPAGFEPVESWFATTAGDLAREQEQEEAGSWMERWEHGGFDHVERHDDRVQLFATRLAAGTHTFSYIVRATTAGEFGAAPVRAEEMYTPEVFGRSASATVTVSVGE